MAFLFFFFVCGCDDLSAPIRRDSLTLGLNRESGLMINVSVHESALESGTLSFANSVVIASSVGTIERIRRSSVI